MGGHLRAFYCPPGHCLGCRLSREKMYLECQKAGGHQRNQWSRNFVFCAAPAQ